MFATVIGNLTAILLVVGLVWVSAKEIIRSHKSGGCGGGCSGCSGSCAGCGKCSHSMPEPGPTGRQKGSI